jgi:uncharacterized protein YbgA (DUF1722 family)/uncharacterized protein YbbK (DUF523 family)
MLEKGCMKIAVSACLLGAKVRFDGGHKHDRFITDELGRHADFVPFCPEAMAYGTPRPSIRLVRNGSHIYVSSNKTGSDVTPSLTSAIDHEHLRIADEPLRGIIFKSKSPSCGFGSAKIHLPNGHTEGKGDGLFVQQCKAVFPLLPMEEESRLLDPWLRENFVMQLFAYDAIERLIADRAQMKGLVAFHARNKFLLQAKDELRYRRLGQIVGNHDALPFDTLLQQYERVFKEAIAQKSSIKRNRNVLEHMAGFFKRQLTPGEKATLHEQIGDYAAKIVPLITPLSTIALFARKYETAYLLEQTFLEPYPKELALRSHIGCGR